MKSVSFCSNIFATMLVAAALLHSSFARTSNVHSASSSSSSSLPHDHRRRDLSTTNMPPVLLKALELHDTILYSIKEEEDNKDFGVRRRTTEEEEEEEEECEDPPFGFQSLLDGLISTWTRQERRAFAFVSEFYAPEIVMIVYLVYFAAAEDVNDNNTTTAVHSAQSPDAFYPDAEQGREYGRILQDLKVFWGEDGDGDGSLRENTGSTTTTTTSDDNDDSNAPIEVFAFTLRDPKLLKVAYTYAIPFLESIGFPIAIFPSNDPDELVADIMDIFARFPAIDAENNPLWTGNAFAWSEDESGRGIGMGDGIVMLTKVAGLDDVGPDAILAHEYGHQIHLAYRIEFDGTEPEVSRYFELLSDALAGYFLHHPRGRGSIMDEERVMEALILFNSLGSCNLNSPNFHGTYTQRLAAAQFGMDLVPRGREGGRVSSGASRKGKTSKSSSSSKSSRSSGKSSRDEIPILTVEAFIEAFDAEYPLLVAVGAV